VELETPWGRHPESDATASGFYVDWGADTAVTDTADDPWVAAALDTGVDEQPATAWTAPEPAPARPAERPDDLAPAERPDDLGVPSWAGLTWVDPAADDATPPAAAPELAPISWRPLADGVLAAVTVELAGHADDLGTAAAQPDPEPVEEFVVAGGQWELGNAVPLVEVRGQGGLVMRRADERWALADVRSARSFALEVEVDFRAGPGFGVLFRATTDDDGRMSGYSFDVDPIHEGGSYLIRQWQGDRELWNPIAHVPAPDPSEMHGALTLRVVVIGDAVTACVNGVTLLRVDSLERACATRNREPVTGDRVGIQAWSSSDLVIDTLRVAER
jgi:hypothetical protein